MFSVTVKSLVMFIDSIVLFSSFYHATCSL